MAYTNEKAEEIVDFLSSEQGLDLPDSIAIAHALTGDDEVLQNLNDEQLRMVQVGALEINAKLIKTALECSKTLN